MSDDNGTYSPTQVGEMGSSRKAGLLRLFASDVFDAWMALLYLWRYGGTHVGIQCAIFDRLRRMPINDVMSLIPQFWYAHCIV